MRPLSINNGNILCTDMIQTLACTMSPTVSIHVLWLLMNDGLIWINGMKTWSYTCFQNFFVLTSHLNVTIPLHTQYIRKSKERLKPSHRPNSPRTNIIPLQAGHCLGQFQRWSFILEHLMVYTQITKSSWVRMISGIFWGWILMSRFANCIELYS